VSYIEGHAAAESAEAASAMTGYVVWLLLLQQECGWTIGF